MAVRPIDADKVLKIFKKWIDTKQVEGEELRAVETCIAVIEDMPTLTPPSDPLTLEQLREMEDPVWCVCKTVEGFEGFWCLCDHGYILTPARQIFDVKEIPHWVFYRRPPEGEEREA